mgnify:FL=1|nr:MAG TPA: hypothetical protein [Caudoviricetes sp.]
MTLYEFKISEKLKAELIELFNPQGSKSGYKVKLVSYSGQFEVVLINETYKDLQTAENKFDDVVEDAKQLLNV